MGIARGWEKRVIRTNIRYAKRTVPVLSPVSLSVFSFVPDLLFDCSRVLEYAKIRTVLQSTLPQKKSGEETRGDVCTQATGSRSIRSLKSIFKRRSAKLSKCYIPSFWVSRHPEACDIRVNCHAMLFRLRWIPSVVCFILDRKNRFDMAALYFSVVVVPSINGDKLERFCDLNKGICPLLFRSTTGDTTAGNLGDSDVRYASLNASRS